MYVWSVSVLDNKRRIAIQGLAALLQNAHFTGFFTGKLYRGAGKSVCVPGLNCYSCPGAVGACPIGSLQNTLSGYKFKVPYYVVGLLLFFGAVLGRMICGFLCPFGLLQDLLYKVPFFRKLKTFKGDKVLRWLKYAVLIVMVIVLPVCVKLTPFFCKYVCPSGTISGILLSFADTRLYQVLGSAFMWKVCVLAMIVLASLLICRPFCRYLCPLGAIYGMCNPVSVVRMKVDHEKCVSCGRCQSVCPMHHDPSVKPNGAECIRCTGCISACPTQALMLTTVFEEQKEKAG